MPIQDRLVVLVEGNRDELFVKQIIKPILINRNKYKDVLIYKYANINKTQNARFIRVSEQQHDALLCMVDFDDSICKSDCKVKVKSNHIGELGDDKILVVIKEIESWLLAGIGDKCCRRLGVDNISETDSITKEQFHGMIDNSKYRNRTSCIIEMVRHYEVNIAVDKNKSFKYLVDKVM